jgi:NADH:ubiquinone oxidoreductase subunit 6 (subunit J)
MKKQLLASTALTIEQTWIQRSRTVPDHWIWGRSAFALLLLLAPIALQHFNGYIVLRSLWVLIIYGVYAAVTQVLWRMWLRDSTEIRRRKQKVAIGLFVGFNCLDKFLISVLLVLLAMTKAAETGFLPNVLLTIIRIIIVVYALTVAVAFLFAPKFMDTEIQKHYEQGKRSAPPNKWRWVVAVVFIFLISVAPNSVLDSVIALSFIPLYGVKWLFAAALEYYQLGIMALADIVGSE